MLIRSLILTLALSATGLHATDAISVDVADLLPADPAAVKVAVVEEVKKTEPAAVPEEKVEVPEAPAKAVAETPAEKPAEAPIAPLPDEDADTATFEKPAEPDPKTVVFDIEGDAPPVEVNCSHSLTIPQGYDAEVLMLQIFLDRRNFSCGQIDGVWGRNTQLAMRAWQASEGLAQTPWVDPSLYSLIATMPEPYAEYTITEEDMKKVTGPTPPTWSARSQVPYLGYATIGEFLAENFHTAERFLQRINPNISWPEGIRAGTVVKVPNVQGAALVDIADITIQLDVFRLVGYDKAGKVVAWFPCSIARNHNHIPEVRDLTVTVMVENPNYCYDPKNYNHDASIGKMMIQPGPRNPVGAIWIGLNLPGYGIHGTPAPGTVGRAESRGCFRLTNWNAQKLFEMIKVGTRVKIVNVQS